MKDYSWWLEYHDVSKNVVLRSEPPLKEVNLFLGAHRNSVAWATPHKILIPLVRDGAFWEHERDL